MDATRNERGLALLAVMMLLALLMSLLLGYFTLTRIGLTTTGSTMEAVSGLYAAEAGLNLRADLVRQIFVGYNRPGGTSPDPSLPTCRGGNMGSGDMACVEYPFTGDRAVTYLVEPPGNPEMIVVPRGELYQNLHAQEYNYQVNSMAEEPGGRARAILELHFKSRLIPMFQFAAFYNKDLEILPGVSMILEGPVHTNGDLYVGTSASLDIEGQVTAAGDVYRGRKDTNVCLTGAVRVIDPENLTGLPACSGDRELLPQSALDAWNGMVESHVDAVTVPDPEALDPTPGEVYWDKADIRIVLDLNGGTPEVQVRDPDGTVNAADTATLVACGDATYSSGLYNNRESAWIKMLNVDVRGLLDCLHDNLLMGPTKDLDETSEGGLVWYLGVDGPASAGVNNYGVRVRNGAELAATSVGAPEIRGLTVVTNQAAYVQGDYNRYQKKPAAVLADSVNVLSNAWLDTDSDDSLTSSTRDASDTTINAAFLAGTDTTGGIEGAGGQTLGVYNGGLENYPRLHEDWAGPGRTLTYRGSFVSLNTPLHVDGAWVYGAPQYTAPTRDWRYDTDFDDAANLPPLSPRFVYLRQELFVRKFEL